MNRIRSSPLDLPQLLRAAGSGLRRLPGTAQVNRVAEGALDWITVVPPRGRRIAIYTGAGILGVAGVVEWPVALTGAAAAWLTQPRPELTAHPTAGQDGDPPGERARTPQVKRRPAAVAPGTAQTGRRPAPTGPEPAPAASSPGTPRADRRPAPAAPGLAPASSRPGPASPPDTASQHPGAGARLTPAHFHHQGPRRQGHEQPAKAGDPATASALKQVAQASTHRDTHM